MNETKTISDLDALIHDQGGEATPDHDAWVRKHVRKRLAKKKAGTAIYHDLDDVAAEFGFDARPDS